MTSARVPRGEAAAVAARAGRAGMDHDGGRLRVAEVAGGGRLLRRPGVGVIVGVGALVVSMFAVAGAHTLLISQQAHIDRTNVLIAQAEARSEELRVQLAELQSPQYVTTRATTVLGMVPAPTPVYLQTRPGDDERAAEMPPVTPPTTVRTTPPSTVARSTTPTTVARSSTPTTVARSATSTPGTVAR